MKVLPLCGKSAGFRTITLSRWSALDQPLPLRWWLRSDGESSTPTSGGYFEVDFEVTGVSSTSTSASTLGREGFDFDFGLDFNVSGAHNVA